MKASNKYILIVLVFGLSICLGADWFLQKGFEKSDDDVIGKLNELLNNNTHHQILCFGSSRGLAHFNSAIIEKETGLTAYNAGLNGGSVVDFNAVFKAYLEKHPAPKIVIIHVDDFTFSTQNLRELPRYFPFVSNDVLYENMVKYDKTFLVVKYVRFLRLMYYSDLLKWISLKSWLNIGSRDEYKLVKGYRVSKSQWSVYFEERLKDRIEFIKELNPSEAVDKEGEKLFREMVYTFHKNGIKMIFTSSPSLSGIHNRKYHHTTTLFEELYSGDNVSFLWMHEENWNHEEYFYDFLHMNNKGANRYSLVLADFINQSR